MQYFSSRVNITRPIKQAVADATNKAAISGLVTGVVQYALAKMPLKNVQNIASSTSATTVKAYLQDYGKQYLTTSEMNVLSLYTDSLTDNIVMQNKSAMNTYVKQLEAQGKSTDEATKKRFLNFMLKSL